MINPTKIAKIKVGDIVKISNWKERFWCIVLRIRKDYIVAKVDSYLIMKYRYKRGSIIRFNRRNVLEMIR